MITDELCPVICLSRERSSSPFPTYGLASILLPTLPHNLSLARIYQQVQACFSLQRRPQVQPLLESYKITGPWGWSP